jgi:hypothetical protein
MSDVAYSSENLSHGRSLFAFLYTQNRDSFVHLLLRYV